MPPAPEIREIHGKEGKVKILRDRQTEHLRRSYGHAGITGEVSVYLNGISEHCSPDRTGGVRVGVGYDRIYQVSGEVVGL